MRMIFVDLKASVVAMAATFGVFANDKVQSNERVDSVADKNQREEKFVEQYP